MHGITYFAVFEPVGDGGYSVYFPDVPGCISCGETLDQARRMAKEALALHLYGLEQEGEHLPVPAGTLRIEPETAAGYLVAPVTVSPEQAGGMEEAVLSEILAAT